MLGEKLNFQGLMSFVKCAAVAAEEDLEDSKDTSQKTKTEENCNRSYKKVLPRVSVMEESSKPLTSTTTKRNNNGNR